MGEALSTLGRRTTRMTAAAAAMTLAAGVLTATGAPSTLTFGVCGVALALLAALVGTATEELSMQMGPGPTGVLQSALGNLPELFVGIFALREGLVGVVQAALVGSILGNSLLVLGIAFFAGGLRHGTQRFHGETARMLGALILLAVSAMAMPTLAAQLGTPAAAHEEALGIAVSIMLLAVFGAALVVSLRGQDARVDDDVAPFEEGGGPVWPLRLTLGMLAAAGGGAALVSDWFVAALTPATQTLHLSQGFTGLVIVAIAGNAVEHAVGVTLMFKNRCDVALNVILQSSLQIALALTPALVLLSFVVGGTHLTLAFPPLLLAALALTAVVQMAIVFDGESTWIEGVALIGLYAVIAATFWWG
jgi:Ca2+:H+ antiporter